MSKFAVKYFLKKFFVLCMLILFLFGAGIIFFINSRGTLLTVCHKTADRIAYNRIVSLSPNITEILFALGLGESVVGVTRFCLYPPEAQEKKKVGGFIDPNYEAIAALQPDLVLVNGSHFHTPPRPWRRMDLIPDPMAPGRPGTCSV